MRDSFKPNRRRLMPAQILDGRALAAEMRTELKLRAVTLRARGVLPRLAILFVGENESSLAYVRNLIH
ncbi:MAG TPA: tetrahydrofolate dehydrogenase/cyclohydrolase catalytic domain-containing protein, partial [Candidatus Dormibacteraeota bacterium]|nr:tetrahydrofolate dehydrogenase/cyclohydrolase catalytic domain-containing protein [Candidatus Dormibacteraeota bacterium]